MDRKIGYLKKSSVFAGVDFRLNLNLKNLSLDFLWKIFKIDSTDFIKIPVVLIFLLSRNLDF